MTRTLAHHRFLPALLASVLPVLCPGAATPPSEPEAAVGARMPSLCPDGRQIAFVYRGDVWVAGVDDGRARPLTQHIESDAHPLFSPDGKSIAFASKRTGNWDIFVMPAQGGPARQLTFHAGSDLPGGWSPDSRTIYFAAKRDTTDPTVYALDVASLRLSVMTADYAPLLQPALSPDGRSLAYGRSGFHWTRPRYNGSAAAQIWLLDTASRARRALTTNEFQHLWTRWMPDGKSLLTVTVGEATPSASKLAGPVLAMDDSPRRTPNLWGFDLEGRATPLTSFTGGGVRCPSVAASSGAIAFEYGADIWLMTNRSAAPRKLRLFAAADDKQNVRRREKLTAGAGEAELSPDGKTVAFGLRGDLWTIAVEKPKGVEGRSAEFARRLTDWAGEDSDFTWSSDRKKLYFTSDREAYIRLFELTLSTLEVRALWRNECDVTRVTPSPDGRRLAFWASGKEGGLHILRLEDGSWRRLVRLPGPQWHGAGGGDFAWSPDGQWIAYCQRDGTKAWNLFIVPSAGGEPRNVTRLFAHHGSPAWSADGKYLYFQSNRDGDALYVLPLTREAARAGDADFKFEKSTNAVRVAIDFDDADKRIRKHATQYPQADLTGAADGTIWFLAEGDLWSVSYDGKETKRVTTGGGKTGLRITPDGRRALYLQGGEMHVMVLADKKDERVSFTADWTRDVRAERQAAFGEFWRSIDRGFYDPSFHGRDWAALRRQYEPMLSGVETPDEFATLLHMMIGELESSHSEVSASASGPSPVTPHLGFTFDYSWEGPGLKVARVPAGAPGSFERTRIKPGEVVLAVNGKEVSAGEKLYDQINDCQEREFEFQVSPDGEAGPARKVRYKVLTQEEWTELEYNNRLDRLRRRAGELSKGRVGYLHIAAMGAPNQIRFEREVYERLAGSEALIIDVRFNSGGNIADTLIEWLSRKPHGFVRPRDGQPEPTPFHAVNRPIVVLINEQSFSNSEIFPSEIRARGLGRLVGMATPGYVIWTTGMRLIDGTNARLPQSGAYRLDGSNMENQGEPPDVRVPLPPEDWQAGRDPQLDKAVQLLLEDLAARK